MKLLCLFIDWVGLLYVLAIICSIECSRIPTNAASQSRELHQYFMRFNEIESFLKKVVADDPKTFSLEVLGQSHEKRPIYALKVSKNSDLPMIFLDSGIHAREWASISSTIYMIDQISKGHSILNKYQILIVPVVNPDGYEFTHTSNRLWRKNRRHNCLFCCVGVDLNRNFGFHWGGRGTSNIKCDFIYQGPNKNSEPETRAIISGLYKYWSSIEIYLTFHSYGQYILTTYGYESGQYSPTYESMLAIAKNVSEKLFKKFGANYTVGSAADILYPASGGSDDFAAGFMNVPYTYTVELPPADYEDSPQFEIPATDIIPIGKQALAILDGIADLVWTKL